MKILRNLLIVILILVLVLVAALGIAMMVVDPNDYKGRIEQTAARHTNLELDLAGDISWSFMPLGIEIHNVGTRLGDKDFAGMERLIASVDPWSLIRMTPSVHTFTLDGFSARLVKGEDGTGNWERILPESDPQSASASAAGTGPETATDTGGRALDFRVSEIRIRDARISYEDRGTGQSFDLEGATLHASDITLAEDFPLELTFDMSLGEPAFQVAGEISMNMNAGSDLEVFALKGLESEFRISGEPLNGRTATATLTGSANTDLGKETAGVTNLVTTFENLELTSNLNIQGFGSTPEISGNLSLSEFSLVELLKRLGQPPVQAADDGVLRRVALDTAIATGDQTVSLKDLQLRLDDTTFKGTAGYGLEDGAITADLKGNRLNLDRYLPPEQEGDANTQSKEAGDETGADNGNATQTAGSDGKKELVPLEPLRALTLDARLALDELIARNLRVNELLVRVTGDEGVMSVDEISGQLYEGDFEVTARLDARTDNPGWQFTERLSGVKSHPLLLDLLELDLLSGRINLNAEGTSNGNTVDTLIANSNGKASFNIEEGAIEHANFTYMACRGISKIHGESLRERDWGDKTPFNDMSGNFVIASGQLRNTNLTADLAGMRLEGEGVVNLIESVLDYRLGLRVVGEIHRDEACRVNERIQKVTLPVRCRGAFSEEPGKLCGFDSSRFAGVLESMAKQEVKRKVDEGKEKVRKKIKKELGEKAGDALKGLFQ